MYMVTNNTIGLTLGGGLARGLAHIGIIKGFIREGIDIDYICGTSMGSVVAALFACGVKVELMEKLSNRISRRKWLDPTFSKMGIMAGDKVEELLRLLTGKRDFSELKIPLNVVSMDINSGEKVIMKEGKVAKSVRASCAIPGIFTPVIVNNRMLVDGGVISNVPVIATRDMGAGIVIAVDVTSHKDEYKIENIFDVLTKTLEVMTANMTRREVEHADVVIYPDMRGISPSDFQLSGEAVKRGEAAFELALPEIRKVIKERG